MTLILFYTTIMMMMMRMRCLYDGDDDDYDENVNDDDASISLKCRLPESIELLTQIACEFKPMLRFQDAELQNLQNCVYRPAMRQTL